MSSSSQQPLLLSDDILLALYALLMATVRLDSGLHQQTDRQTDRLLPQQLLYKCGSSPHIIHTNFSAVIYSLSTNASWKAWWAYRRK
jgi:hypothetical protein